jgi:hypothetical protein
VFGHGLPDETAFEAFFRQPPADITRLAIPWIIGIGFLGSMIGSALFTIMLAPWAHVYKALTGPTADAA